MKSLFCLGMAAVASLSMGQVLNANATANNGSGGVFMEFTAVNSLSITSFDTFVTAGTGSANIEFWTRPGSYAGFTASNAGWTLHDTAVVGATSSTVLANVDMADISVGAGNVVSVYMHSVTANRGIRYFGTGTTSNTNFSNADLQLFTNTARTGSAAFGGSAFSPRALAGNVNYTVVPEPMTMIAMGAGLLALARRRRAK